MVHRVLHQFEALLNLFGQVDVEEDCAEEAAKRYNDGSGRFLISLGIIWVCELLDTKEHDKQHLHGDQKDELFFYAFPIFIDVLNPQLHDSVDRHRLARVSLFFFLFDFWILFLFLCDGLVLLGVVLLLFHFLSALLLLLDRLGYRLLASEHLNVHHVKPGSNKEIFFELEGRADANGSGCSSPCHFMVRRRFIHDELFDFLKCARV